MPTRATTWILLLLGFAPGAAAEAPAGLSQGIELLEAGDHAAARRFFAGLEASEPSPWLDHYLGRAHLAGGELDAAIERLTQATETRPGSALFHRWLGEAYVAKLDTVGMFKKLGLAGEARTNFEKAVELEPADADARAALADYYINAPAIAGGSKEKARQQAAELAKLDPAEGQALSGRIHIAEEQWDQAAAAYRAAAAAEPTEPRHHYQLGFALQQREDWSGAFAGFERAIEADPTFLAAYYQVGRTAVFAKTNLDRAAECLRHYLTEKPRQGFPGHQHAHWRLGMVLELAGDKSAAAAEYRAALALDPEHKEARKALAVLTK